MIMHTRMNNENNIESLNESLSIENLETILEQNKPFKQIETKVKKIKNLEKKVFNSFRSLEKLFETLKLERQRNSQEGVVDSKLEKFKNALLVWVEIRDLFNEVVKEEYVSKKNRTNLEKKFNKFNNLLNELRSPETESKSELQINVEAKSEAEQVQIEQIETEEEQTQEVVENEAENTVIDTVLSNDNVQPEETTASNENNEKTEPEEKDNEKIKGDESVLFEIIEKIEAIDQFNEVLEKCERACEKFNEKEKLLEALNELQVIYNSLKKDNSRENDIPSEKLVDLKNILLMWREMYFVVNTSFIYEKNKLSEDNKGKLNSFYEKFIRSLNTYKEKYGLNSEAEQTKSEQTNTLNEDSEQDTMQKTELEDSPTQVEHINSDEEDADSLPGSIFLDIKGYGWPNISDIEEDVFTDSETENGQDQEEATTQEEATVTETNESDDDTQQEEVKKGGFLGKIVDSVKSKVSGFFRREKGKSKEQSQEEQPQEEDGEQKSESEEGQEGIKVLTEEQREVLEEIFEEKKEKKKEEISKKEQALNNLREGLLIALRYYVNSNKVLRANKRNKFILGLFLKSVNESYIEAESLARTSKEKYDTELLKYINILKELIKLKGVISDEFNNFEKIIKDQITQEIEKFKQLVEQTKEKLNMDNNNKKLLEETLNKLIEYLTNNCSNDNKFIENLNNDVKTEKNKFITDFNKDGKAKIEEMREQEKREKIGEFLNLEQVKKLKEKFETSENVNIEEKIERILYNLINSGKTEEEVIEYFQKINELLKDEFVDNDFISEFNEFLKGKILEENKDEFYSQIKENIGEILIGTVISSLENGKEGEIDFSDLKTLVTNKIKEFYLAVKRVNKFLSDGVILVGSEGNIVNNLNLDKKQEEAGETSAEFEESTQIESKLKLLDSKKIGKGENIYNFFVGQNLKMKNGSAVLVREIKSDFIVVMEQNGNLIPIFHDEIKDKLQETPSLEMSKLSGSESKEQEKWDELLGSVRDKFIRQPSSPDIFWEYQDALKQYFEANQNSFDGDYNAFLGQEKAILEALGNKNFESVIENLKQSFAVAKEAMDNKARAENKRAEENSKRNKTNETQTSSKEKTVEKPTTLTSKSTASSSPANVSSGGGITRVEKQKNKELGKKFEFAGQEWNQVMSVYFVEENHKSTIIINEVKDDEISFRSSDGGVLKKMSVNEWNELISNTESFVNSSNFSLEEIVDQKDRSSETDAQEENYVASLFSEEDEDTNNSENEKSDGVKKVFIAVIKEIKVGKNPELKQIKDDLIKKLEDEKNEINDSNFVNNLSIEEKFLISFINGLKFNGYLNSKTETAVKEFYAFTNLDNCNLYIVKDDSGMALAKHDKPVKNIGGILVEIENGGEINTVHYEINNNNFILVRD